MLHDLEIPYEWVGIADAEDVFHPDLLRMVDHRFRTTGAGIVLSDLVGKRPFVVDVSRNGIGPPPDGPGGAAQWCNPAHQALGVAPTARTGVPGVDALLWSKRPGESDGKCGGEVSYFFSPRQARELIVNSPAVAPAARRVAESAAAPPASTSPSG